MSKNIPILDLSRAFSGIRDDINAAVNRVFDSQGFILGREVRAFEEHVESYLGLPEGGAIGCASGSDALLLALMALGIGPGDEVITTPYTFFATASAITRLGAKAVFADINPDTYNVDLADVKRKLTSRTKVFLPVHLFGQMTPICPDENLGESAREDAKVLDELRERGIKIVEDAAQSFGAWRRIGNKIHKAGTVGTIGCYSFFPTKNLGGCGDGGMMVTADSELAEHLRRLRVHGEGSTYFHEEVGLNSRLDALQAAILDVKLPHLEAWNEDRRNIADRWRIAFETRGLSGQANAPVKVPVQLAGNYHIYHQYVIRVASSGSKTRDELMAWLGERGIAARIYYPLPLHLQHCFAFLGGHEGDCPESEKLSHEALALPIFPGLTQDEQNIVADAIKAFFNR